MKAAAYALSAIGSGAKKAARGAHWSFLKLTGRLPKELRPILKKPGTYELEKAWMSTGLLENRKVRFREDLEEHRWFRKAAAPKVLGKYMLAAELQAELEARDAAAEKQIREESWAAYRAGWPVYPCHPTYR